MKKVDQYDQLVGLTEFKNRQASELAEQIANSAKEDLALAARHELLLKEAIYYENKALSMLGCLSDEVLEKITADTDPVMAERLDAEATNGQ